jgi:pimeloyl-ACP methyl ester carboxylesterase
MVLAVLTSFDDGRLFGEVYGSGAPKVIALHGWARDHHDFDLVLGGAGALAARSATARLAEAGPGSPSRSPADLDLPESPLPAIGLDLPGFGGTPEPERAWSTTEYASALAPLLDAAAGPVVLVGHSFGGRVALHLAAQHPGRVSGLVLTGAPLFSRNGSSRPPRPSLRYRLVRGLARRGLVGEERLERLRRRYGSADYRAASGVMREVLVKSVAEERDGSYASSLQALACPLELVWGALDTASPPAVAEQIAAAAGGPANLVVLEGVGHMTPCAAPGHLRAAIERVAGP